MQLGAAFFGAVLMGNDDTGFLSPCRGADGGWEFLADVFFFFLFGWKGRVSPVLRFNKGTHAVGLWSSLTNTVTVEVT